MRKAAIVEHQMTHAFLQVCGQHRKSTTRTFRERQMPQKLFLRISRSISTRHIPICIPSHSSYMYWSIKKYYISRSQVSKRDARHQLPSKPKLSSYKIMCNQYMYFYLTRQQYVKLVAYKFLPVAQTSGADAESDNQ